MNGYTIWFTGLSGSGKTTIAEELAKVLRENHVDVVLLDGDIVRQNLSKDLGYTKEERDIHITRVANVCYLIGTNDVLNIACVLSPTRKIRRYARNKIKNFIEVYVKCHIETCIKRDVKGHYKKAKEGKLKNFVGIDIQYEEPEKPEIIINTDKESIKEGVDKILDFLTEVYT